MKIDKVKLLTILVVVLLLLNLVTIASVWMRGPGRHMGPPPHGPREYIISRLGLNEEQTEAFEKLRKEHFDTIQKLREQIKSEKEEMYSGLKSKGNESAAYAHLAKVILYEEQAEKITFEHFRKVRELCDDEQKKHFDAIITQVIKMVGVHTPPPPHGRNNGHGGPPPLP